MEEATKIIVALISLAGMLAGGYWQWVYKPNHKDDADPTREDRALDAVFDDWHTAKREAEQERKAHRVTQDDYLRVAQRLATVEAELKAEKRAREAEKRVAAREIAVRDESLARLRAELVEVRKDIADMRRRHGG